MKMKYIATCNEQGLEEIFLFSPLINHDAMAEALKSIKNRTRSPWSRVHREAVSAGFVTADGVCHGESVSLNLKSRPEDTALLERFMRGGA